MLSSDNLVATETIDWCHPVVEEFIAHTVDEKMNPVEKAVALYYAVRDSIRYDPYRIDLSVEGMKASTTLKKGYGWCVPKAVLLAGCCRGSGIQARLGFGDVKNHMSSERLRQKMQTDVFYWHGYTEIFLENRWVKATPAFNRGLCEKVGIAQLEFDGREDSIFHEYDRSGNVFMEYVQQRGSFSDLPLSEIMATFEQYYPKMTEGGHGDFELDAASYSRSVK